MTVRINTTVDVRLEGDGVVLVNVNEGGIWIWPQGLGVGPCIVMDVADWGRISEEVRLALVRKDGLDSYTACEGHNGDDE